MARLTKITLRGFKSIRALEDFELRPINVLIGENGSGKSNFVSFFRFLSWMMSSSGKLQEYVNTRGFGSSFLFYGPRVTPRLEAQLTFEADSGVNEYAFQLSHAAPDTLIFVDEKYRFSRSDLQTVAPWIQLEGGHREAQLADQADSGETTAKTIRYFLNRCAVNQFHDTSEKSRIRLGWNYLDDDFYLKEDGANLAAILYRLREEEPQYYRRIVETIRMSTSYFDDFVLEPNQGRGILLQWKEKKYDYIMGPHQASDGTLRMMALFTLLQLPHRNLPDLLILDEPELGLHPYAIDLLVEMIQSLSLSKQIILATQSTYLLNHFTPEDIVVVNRIDGESTFKRCSEEELKDWLNDYTISELWEKNVIQGTP